MLLHVPGALDEIPDEDLGVGVDARDDAWGDGLGEGLVDDFADGFFLEFYAAEEVVAVGLVGVEGFDKDAGGVSTSLRA